MVSLSFYRSPQTYTNRLYSSRDHHVILVPTPPLFLHVAMPFEIPPFNSRADTTLQSALDA